MVNALLSRIDTILKNIDTIKNDIGDLSLQDFKKSDLLMRATCFSLGQIGEHMNKLEKEYGERYSKIPWRKVVDMRNIIFHVYNKVKAEVVYLTAKNDLDDLKVALLAMKNDIECGTLITNRLVLRHFIMDDAQEMFDNWANDPEMTKYMTWNPHNNVEETKEILNIWIDEYSKPNTHRYAITLRDSGILIGSIDVVDYVDGVPEIGYCLSRRYWNNGYMSEACKAFIKYLFDIGYDELLIEADMRNIGSNRVIQKCGFTYTHQESKPCSSFKPEIITVNWYRLRKKQ